MMKSVEKIENSGRPTLVDKMKETAEYIWYTIELFGKEKKDYKTTKEEGISKLSF